MPTDPRSVVKAGRQFVDTLWYRCGLRPSKEDPFSRHWLLLSDHSTLTERAALQGELVERAACIRVIVAEVQEMIGRVEVSGDRSKLGSLRLLVGHYQAELLRIERQLSAEGRPRQGSRS